MWKLQAKSSRWNSKPEIYSYSSKEEARAAMQRLAQVMKGYDFEIYLSGRKENAREIN